jgi:glutathione S-transferase
MATQNVTLGYWDIRGLGEPIKALLEYLRIPYSQDKYGKTDEWKAKKSTMNMDFPNLPYLIDGEKSLSETEAILGYLCLKANKPEMLGKPEDAIEFIQLKGIVGDIQNGITRPSYGSKSLEEFKKACDDFVLGGGKYKFDGIEAILGKREWLLGYLTYLDFWFVELVERFEDIDKEVGTKIIANYPNLQAYVKRFLELPEIKEYRQSGRFQARPHNNYMAIWK